MPRKAPRRFKLSGSAVAAAVSVALAGCGASAAQPSAYSTAPAVTASVARATAPAQRAPSVAVRTAAGYGQLLVDGAGRTLYLFTADRAATATCHDACATAWPPLITDRPPRAGPGIQASRLSVVRRSGGQLQVAYFGHPLYYFLGDRQPGQINCQNAEEFGGHWWLVKPDGQQNRLSP